MHNPGSGGGRRALRPRRALDSRGGCRDYSTHLVTGSDPVARTPSELLQGTVDILILRALAWEPMHGYAISRWLDVRSAGVLSVDGAALYQALHRLEERRLVSASWGTSENNRKAKYYTLTSAGRARLRTESAVWKTYADAVSKVLKPA